MLEKVFLKLIYSVTQCSKITNTMLFLKHDFSVFVQFSTSNFRMFEGRFCRVGALLLLIIIICHYYHYYCTGGGGAAAAAAAAAADDDDDDW